jgi:hypothetical protein
MNLLPPDPPAIDYDDYWVCDCCEGKRLEGSPEYPLGPWVFCSAECKRKYQSQL